MSSILDDLNSRAYASADRYWRNRDLDDGMVDTGGTCVICGTDRVTVDWASRCAVCAGAGMAAIAKAEGR